MSILARVVAATALALALAACGSARPTAPPDNHVCGLAKYQVDDDLQKIGVYFQRPHLQAVNQPKTINVLELSAGGEYGSYGAGFLVGWSSVGDEAKPARRSDIQVVTGVSTGALMSTYAFLGGMDDKLKQFYLGLTDDQIYAQRSTLALIWANSLFDAAGKQKLLETYITPDIVDAVAHQPANRRLYIGVTDLDSGQFIRIDMVALAKGITDPTQRLDCYRSVINAATAIEVAFPPIFIDGRMLGDGGARRHLFIVSPNYFDGSFDPAHDKLQLLSIVHGNLQVPDVSQTSDGHGGVGVPNGILDIAERVENLFVDQSLKDSVRLSNALAHDPSVVVGDKLGPSLPLYSTYYAASASAACKCNADPTVAAACGPNSSSKGADLFCHPFMACLEQAGEVDGAQFAKSGQWLSIADLNLGSGPACTMPAATPRARPKFE